VIKVTKAGLATVQDLGRFGHLGSGIAWNGAADGYAAKVANGLLGNQSNAPLIEILALPFKMVASTELLLCVTGAPANVFVGGHRSPQWRVLTLPAGATLGIDTIRHGLRTYVGIRGGIEAEGFVGSCAPDATVPLGRPLKTGEELMVGREPASAVPSGYLKADQIPRYGSPWTLDVLEGPDVSGFVRGLEQLCATEYRVQTDSNQAGIRLEGPPLGSRSRRELLSRGVTVGAVEVLPGGQPLILGQANSVTGGYPVLAVVARTHTHLLGQLRPGDRVLFRAIDIRSAVDAVRLQGQLLAGCFSQVPTRSTP
jgi:biotin-dependent carboxylase-like uncharacterized protein